MNSVHRNGTATHLEIAWAICWRVAVAAILMGLTLGWMEDGVQGVLIAGILSCAVVLVCLLFYSIFVWGES